MADDSGTSLVKEKKGRQFVLFRRPYYGRRTKDDEEWPTKISCVNTIGHEIMEWSTKLISSVIPSDLVVIYIACVEDC